MDGVVRADAAGMGPVALATVGFKIRNSCLAAESVASGLVTWKARLFCCWVWSVAGGAFSGSWLFNRVCERERAAGLQRLAFFDLDSNLPHRSPFPIVLVRFHSE